MKIRRAAVVLAVASSLVVGGQAQASAAIRIMGAQWDPPGADRGSNWSLNREWVVLRNTGKTARSLNGWRVHDSQGFTYRFADYQLRPGAEVKIHTGSGRDSSTDVFWDHDWYVWNNDKDRITVKNRGGDVVDSCRYNQWWDSLRCD